MLNEIELPSGRISTTVFDFEGSAKEAIDNAEKFNLEAETPGFSDYEFSETITRGYFSFVEPYETENIVDGITVSEAKKRIKTAEFAISNGFLFAWGASSAVKLLGSFINNDFATANRISFEFEDLHNLQSRFELCKSVKVKNPKEMPVKTVSMAGKLDTYSEYNCLDAHNHELKSVSGVLNMPIGKANVTANDKGVIKIAVKGATVLPVDALVWLIKLIHNAE